MLKAALAGEDHGHGGVGFVAGLDGFVVPHGAPRVGDGADTLAEAHVHPVPEGKEGVRDHHRADEAPLGLLGFLVDFHFIFRFPVPPEDFQLHILVRQAIALEAERVGVFGVGLEDGDLRHPHPVLFAGADAHG